MAENETLYEQLGGHEAISAVVDRFYERVLSEESLRHYFEDIEMQSLRAHQTQFFSAVTGGPVEYSGKEMKTAHSHLEITTDDFRTVGEHLQATLQEFNVPDAAIEEVMDTVLELEDEIVAT